MLSTFPEFCANKITRHTLLGSKPTNFAVTRAVSLVHFVNFVSNFVVDSIILAESIPLGLTYPPGSPSHPSIYHTWLDLIEMATESIDIASFYWTLKGTDIHDKDPSDYEVTDVITGHQRVLRLDQ